MTSESLSPAEIFNKVTGGQGAESLGETDRVALQLSERLLDRIDRIAQLSAKVRAGWQGASAEEAANSTTPLMAATADHSTSLVSLHAAANDQISAFQLVKNTVKPIGDRPKLTPQDVYDLIHGNSSYFRKLDQWQADAQHNVDAYAGYNSATETNTAAIPALYAELAGTDFPPISVAGATGSQKHPAPGPVSGKPPTGHGPEAPVTEAGKPAPGSTAPVQEEREARPGNGSHTPWIRPGNGETRSTEPQPSPASGASPPNPTRISSHEPSLAPLPTPPGYRFGPSGQPVAANGPSGFVPLGYSPGGPPEGNSGSRSNTGSEPGPRGRFGAGNGAGAAVEPVPGRSATGTPGAAGKASSMLSGGIPGKAGEKEEDKAKRAPAYLHETDPNELFGGSDLKPVPPVIGADQPPH